MLLVETLNTLHDAGVTRWPLRSDASYNDCQRPRGDDWRNCENVPAGTRSLFCRIWAAAFTACNCDQSPMIQNSAPGWLCPCQGQRAEPERTAPRLHLLA